MKIVVAPDKFKGSLSSFDACEAIRRGVEAIDPAIEVLRFPMADGGDGFAAVCGYYLKTTTVTCPTTDPLGRPMQASYEWSPSTHTALIELAVASGMTLLTPEERNPLLTSTAGTGELVRHACAQGATRIVLGLGGSATNDAGLGVLSALGFKARDRAGAVLPPIGESLARVVTIEPPHNLPIVSFDIAADVQNPLFGKNGAAHIYAAQKGATAAMIEQLDAGLRHFADVLKAQTGRDVAQFPGSGAAGGVAAGLAAFFPTQVSRGIDLVIEMSGFERALSGATLVVTGEGKLDGQTLEGKVIQSIAAGAAAARVPVIALCGRCDVNETELGRLGLADATSIAPATMPLTEAFARAPELLQRAASAAIAKALKMTGAIG